MQPKQFLLFPKVNTPGFNLPRTKTYFKVQQSSETSLK